MVIFLFLHFSFMQTRCVTKSLLQVYTNLKGNRPHIVNTAWAMLALIDAEQVQ